MLISRANWAKNCAVWEDLRDERRADRHTPATTVRPLAYEHMAMTSRTAHQTSHPSARLLLADELSGFAGARVRRGSDEPVGDTVSLEIGGSQLRFYWGRAHELGTSAYWMEQTRLRGAQCSYALGDTLAQEVAACLLGGHGVPADIGLAAYYALRDDGLLDPPVQSADEYEARLRVPLCVPGRARRVRYRFARQRAERLAGSLAIVESSTPPKDALALRDWLTSLPGVGPKTASWIVRNRSASDDVAIIDVHVHRAGVAAGFFSTSWRLPRDYAVFEEAFCAVARLAGVSAPALDACMWDQMQQLGRAQYLLLGQPEKSRRALG
jgi:thermostable 8-oxoguanine DNA glycosylase